MLFYKWKTQILMAVFRIWVSGGRWSKTFMPPNSPQIKETQFPILQRSMGNELS